MDTNVVNLRKKPAPRPSPVRKNETNVSARPKLIRREPTGQRSAHSLVAAAPPSPESVSSSFIWNAPYVYRRNKTAVWLAAISLCTLGMIFFITEGEVLLTIILGMAALTLLLYSSHEELITEAKITAQGVHFAGRSHEYENLESFWIEYSPNGQKEIKIKTTKWYMPHIKIPLVDQNPIQIRTLMVQYLPEVKHEDSLVDHFSRHL